MRTLNYRRVTIRRDPDMPGLYRIVDKATGKILGKVRRMPDGWWEATKYQTGGPIYYWPYRSRREAIDVVDTGQEL